MSESLISRVRRGAALLDKKRRSKAWRKKIDLDRLNMATSCNCIGGQLYGNYVDAPEWLMSSDAFIGLGLDYFDDVRALTRAWKRYLA